MEKIPRVHLVSLVARDGGLSELQSPSAGCRARSAPRRDWCPILLLIAHYDPDPRALLFSFLLLPRRLGCRRVSVGKLRRTPRLRICWNPSWIPVLLVELDDGRSMALLPSVDPVDRPLGCGSSCRSRSEAACRSWSSRSLPSWAPWQGPVAD